MIHLNKLVYNCLCDKFICIWLTKLWKAYFVCFSIALQVIEAIASSGTVKDHRHTINYYLVLLKFVIKTYGMYRLVLICLVLKFVYIYIAMRKWLDNNANVCEYQAMYLAHFGSMLYDISCVLDGGNSVYVMTRCCPNVVQMLSIFQHTNVV